MTYPKRIAFACSIAALTVSVYPAPIAKGQPTRAELRAALTGTVDTPRKLAATLRALEQAPSESLAVIEGLICEPSTDRNRQLMLLVMAKNVVERNDRCAVPYSHLLTRLLLDDGLEKDIRDVAARCLNPNLIDGEDAEKLAHFYAELLPKAGLATQVQLEGVAKALAAREQVPELLREPAIEALTSLLPSAPAGTRILTSHLALCRRLDPEATGKELRSWLLRCVDPVHGAATWGLMNDEERGQCRRLYEGKLRTWIESHCRYLADDPELAKALSRGFEGEAFSYLIRQLRKDDAHKRLDAVMALRNITGKDFDYNPADPPDVREAAIDRWTKYSAARLQELRQATDAPTTE